MKFCVLCNISNTNAALVEFYPSHCCRNLHQKPVEIPKRKPWEMGQEFYNIRRSSWIYGPELGLDKAKVLFYRIFDGAFSGSWQENTEAEFPSILFGKVESGSPQGCEHIWIAFSCYHGYKVKLRLSQGHPECTPWLSYCPDPTVPWQLLLSSVSLWSVGRDLFFLSITNAWGVRFLCMRWQKMRNSSWWHEEKLGHSHMQQVLKKKSHFVQHCCVTMKRRKWIYFLSRATLRLCAHFPHNWTIFLPYPLQVPMRLILCWNCPCLGGVGWGRGPMWTGAHLVP